MKKQQHAVPADLTRAINRLVTCHGKTFENLSTLSYVPDTETAAIAYNIQDNTVHYNPVLIANPAHLTSSLAFIGLLARDKGYAVVPRQFSMHTWNIASHLHIMQRLNSISLFEFVENVYDTTDYDLSGTVAEIAAQVAADIQIDVLYDTEFEADTQ